MTEQSKKLAAAVEWMDAARNHPSVAESHGVALADEVERLQSREKTLGDSLKWERNETLELQAHIKELEAKDKLLRAEMSGKVAANKSLSEQLQALESCGAETHGEAAAIMEIVRKARQSTG